MKIKKTAFLICCMGWLACLSSFVWGEERDKASRCDWAQSQRLKTCEDAFNFCDSTYKGNGGENKWAGIPPEKFKTEVANCANLATACAEASYKEAEHCCCKAKDPSLRHSTEGVSMCAHEIIVQPYYCRTSKYHCDTFLESIQDKDKFTTNGFNSCLYSLKECRASGLQKDQLCECK